MMMMENFVVPIDTIHIETMVVVVDVDVVGWVVVVDIHTINQVHININTRPLP